MKRNERQRSENYLLISMGNFTIGKKNSYSQNVYQSPVVIILNMSYKQYRHTYSIHAYQGQHLNLKLHPQTIILLQLLRSRG